MASGRSIIAYKGLRRGDVDPRQVADAMNCPNCRSEMLLRYYKSPEEAMKEVLRYLPKDLIGKPVWFCRRCLNVVKGY